MLLNGSLMQQNPEAWTLQTVAHESKHFAKDDNRSALLVLAALAFAASWLMQWAGSALAAHCGDRFGFTKIGDPRSLPLMAMLLCLIYLLLLPPTNAFRQYVELEADRFAIELTQANVVQGEMLSHYAAGKGRVPEYSTFFALFRATHPSDAERIRLSNTYRPWVTGEPLRYSSDFKSPLAGK
jgi:Zn-dependent protease with chaperone function